MKCPKCGKPNPAGGAFCMHCGQPLVAPSAAPVAQGPMHGAPGTAAAMGLGSAFDAHRKRNMWIASGVGVAALAAALVLGGASGLLKLGAFLPSAHNLSKQVAIGPPVLQKTDKGMPSDVEDWLKHLQETERRKVLLTNRQFTEFKGMLDVMQVGVTTPEQVQELTDPDKVLDKTPQNETLQSMVSEARPAWYRLNDFFLSKPAPPECKTIEANYSVGLQQLGDSMGDIAKIVDSLNPMSPDLNNDIKKDKNDVYEIQQTHRETVDESFKKALYGVDDVCQKYGKKRWFDIDTSGGGSGILGNYIGGG